MTKLKSLKIQICHGCINNRLYVCESMLLITWICEVVVVKRMITQVYERFLSSDSITHSKL